MTARTTLFRTQHAEFHALIAELEGALTTGKTPESIRPLFQSLFAKLTVHLAIEDSTMYPWMLSHADPRVRTTAQRYKDEMGGLKDTLEVWRSHWLGAAASDPAAFRAEAQRTVAALKQRITREDGELYPLYDRAEEASAA